MRPCSASCDYFPTIAPNPSIVARAFPARPLSRQGTDRKRRYAPPASRGPCSLLATFLALITSRCDRFKSLHRQFETWLAFIQVLVWLYKYLYSNHVEVTRKPLQFVGTSHDDLKAFPDEARRDAGFNLDFVQRGLEPENWKPMKTVGPGVKEIRVRDATGAYRVVYLATRPEAVYVLHCFQKKTQKTRKADIELAAGRFAQIGD
jgi:phage-related protein